MNRILFLMIAVMAASICSGQKVKEQEVPSVVKDVFKKAYPDAEEVKWERESGNYEVSFDLQENDISVLYDANGNVLETEIEIEPSQLPADVIEFVKNNHKGKKIKEASKITYADSSVMYEAEVGGKDLIFDSRGKFIHTVKD